MWPSSCELKQTTRRIERAPAETDDSARARMRPGGEERSCRALQAAAASLASAALQSSDLYLPADRRVRACVCFASRESPASNTSVFQRSARSSRVPLLTYSARSHAGFVRRPQRRYFGSFRFVSRSEDPSLEFPKLPAD